MSSYVRNLIASAVFHFTGQRSGASKKGRVMARQFLPYALFLRQDGRLLVLNRDYKPVGTPPGLRERVDYESDEYLSLTVPADGSKFRPTNPERSANMCMLYAGSPWSNRNDAMELKRRLGETLGMMAFTENGEGEGSTDHIVSW